MNIGPRLRKEALVLFGPWCAVLLALGGVMLWHFFYTIQFWDEVLRTGAPVLGLGAAFLAALSFGNEFQSRTLPMLLSQPCSRLRLWGEKMLMLTCFLLPLLLAYPVWREIGGNDDWSLLADFSLLFALACSTGYWTLFARSTLGGMAFSLAAVGVLMLSVTFGTGKLWQHQPELVSAMTPVVMALTACGYALFSLLLGWSKFSRLELSSTDSSESGMSATAHRDAPAASLLRSRTGSPLRNLLRKELRLQRPLLAIALLFTLFWLAMAGLAVLVPLQRQGIEMLLEVVVAFYLTLSLVLAGCLPLGEERALGIHPSNLTLPVAARTQWGMKLGVALVVGGLAGIALPAGLAAVTRQAVASPLPGYLTAWSSLLGNERPAYSGRLAGDLWLGIAALELLVLLGFWSATMVNRVAWSALLTLLSVFGLFVAGWLGIWGVTHIPGLMGFSTKTFLNGSSYWVPRLDLRGQVMVFDGSFMRVLTWCSVHLHLPLSSLYNFVSHHANIGFVALLTMVAVIWRGGRQSWRAFQTPASNHRGWSRALGAMTATVTLAAVLGLLFLRSVATMSPYMGNSPLAVETVAALKALKLPPATPAQIVLKVPVADLAATGQLSAQTQAWLSHCTVEITVTQREHKEDSFSRRWINNLYWAHVLFPGGETDDYFFRDEIITISRPSKTADAPSTSR